MLSYIKYSLYSVKLTIKYYPLCVLLYKPCYDTSAGGPRAAVNIIQFETSGT